MAEEVSFAEKIDRILDEVGNEEGISPITFTLPLTPQKLNEQLRSAADIYAGALKVGNYRYSTFVPGEYTVLTHVRIPEGWLDTSTIIELTSDYYNPDFEVEVYSDRRGVHPGHLPFSGPIELDFGSFYAKREITIVFLNYTTTDIIATHAGKLCAMKEELYSRLYKPAIELTNDIFGGLVTKKIPISLIEE